jgi:hypothetical protein
MGAFVYMLRCADGSYYVGTATGDDLTRRINAVADALDDEQVVQPTSSALSSGPSPFEARPSGLAPQGDGLEIGFL